MSPSRWECQSGKFTQPDEVLQQDVLRNVSLLTDQCVDNFNVCVFFYLYGLKEALVSGITCILMIW